MRKKLSFAFVVVFFNSAFSQAIVSFDDIAFKSKLVFSTSSTPVAKNAAGNWIKVDTNNDLQIQVSEAQQVAELWLLGSNISSLKGIQSFTNLKVLDIGSNNLTSLDVSQNSQLKTLYCSNNNLTTLIVNQNLLLENLYCLWNDISTLDLPNSSVLQKVDCANNQISNLNTNNNTGLKILNVRNNPITNLSLSSNINLEQLDFSSTSISDINLASNINLKRLTTSSHLANLNISQNTSLTHLSTRGNNLVSVDVRNGNNGNMYNVHFGDVSQSPLLKCIFVGWKNDPVLTNFWIKPYTATYVENESECNALLNATEVAKDDIIKIYPNPVSDILYISSFEFTKYEIVDNEGRTVKYGSNLNNQIDVTVLPFGAYFLKLESKINSITKKFIKN